MVGWMVIHNFQYDDVAKHRVREKKRKENAGMQIWITGTDTDEVLVLKFWDHNIDWSSTYICQFDIKYFFLYLLKLVVVCD